MAYGLAFTQAIYILVFVGDKTGRGDYEYVPTPLIAETLNIPKPSVVKLLQSLNQSGIIETGAGKNGGVRLMAPPESISLFQVFAAIEGRRPLFRLDHTIRAEGPRPEQVAHEIQRILVSVEQEMHASLRNHTLSDLVRYATE
jgi:Rrf2 family protein